MLNKIKHIFLLLVGLALLFLILDKIYPLDTNRIFKPKSTVIYDKNNQVIRVHLSEDGFLRMPIENKNITNDIKDVLLSYEDKYFYEHFGVNPISILRALWFNLQNKRVIGASTITMQLARMSHHKPRTIKSKIYEIFMAFQLEYHYTKDEILELYLNNTPYGGNIEGFASAAYKYFGVPVESLSLAQIAYLVSIPKNPNRNLPKSKNNNHVNKLKNIVLDRIDNKSTIYKQARKETIYPKRISLPFMAPHLSTKIKTANTVHTTIDLKLQKRLEMIISKQIKSIKPLGIHNGSAVVIDNKNMEILAYVGSQDFNDKKFEGQVDGITSIVSPGSTLKPFVYARALDKGYVTPLKKLYDIPLNISGYKPLNYNREFMGEVTASRSLQESLNIPAIDLNNLLEDDSLFHLLKDIGIKSIEKDEAYYGSGIVLGGFGMKLIELSELFAALANEGIYRKSTYIKDTTISKGRRIVSKEAAYLISDILADAPRDIFSSSWEYMRDAHRIAFKTGTSARAKDLLSVGYTPEYTVAVWFGNFNKKHKRDKEALLLTGIDIAFPTLHEIIKVLNPKEWFDKPKNIVEDVICQDALKVGECKNSVKDLLISNVYPNTPCKLLRTEVLAKLFKENTIEKISDLESHECYPKWSNYKPKIMSPIDKATYTQNILMPKEYKKIPIECYSFKEDSQVNIFIDNEEPLKVKSGQKIYMYLSPGKHTVKCLDQGSNISESNIDILEL